MYFITNLIPMLYNNICKLVTARHIIGYVDYISGSKRFDAISNNDMAFLDLDYSF